MNMEDLYRLLRTGHAQAQGIVDTISDPMLLLDERLCVQNASRAFFDTFKVNRSEAIGRPIHELNSGEWDIADLGILLTQVIPRSTAIVDYRMEHDFPSLGHKVMLLTARMLHHPDNNNHMMLLSIVDITERAEQNAETDLLFGELKHRMKNLLSVARSIARHAPTDGRSAAQYRDEFLGRFEALVEAQELGFVGDEATDLVTLIERVLAPYARPDAVQIKAEGAVILGSSTMTSLGLVLHELATNAAKYGALSLPEGRVSIGWQANQANSHMLMTWCETRGPPVTPPTKTGFGNRLIQTAIYRGEVKQTYAPTGLEVEISIPFGASAMPR